MPVSIHNGIEKCLDYFFFRMKNLRGHAFP
ncbi:MAG: hypothetical protein HFACDABA_02927 [Anaerolineales bacterium]|nr:hypothetical protein [Anaerolineales bacterium]